MYIYIYMLAIAGQTAGPNWLNFLRELGGTLGVRIFEFIFVQKQFF